MGSPEVLTLNSTVLRVLLMLLLYQDVSRATSCLYVDSAPSWISPMTVVSSANVRGVIGGAVHRQKTLGTVS